MDAITFTQERMKRQLDDLEGKTSVSNTFIILWKGIYIMSPKRIFSSIGWFQKYLLRAFIYMVLYNFDNNADIERSY